jgi:hypothetical protein
MHIVILGSGNLDHEVETLDLVRYHVVSHRTSRMKASFMWSRISVIRVILVLDLFFAPCYNMLAKFWKWVHHLGVCRGFVVFYTPIPVILNNFEYLR